MSGQWKLISTVPTSGSAGETILLAVFSKEFAFIPEALWAVAWEKERGAWTICHESLLVDKDAEIADATHWAPFPEEPVFLTEEEKAESDRWEQQDAIDQAKKKLSLISMRRRRRAGGP